MFWGKDKKRKGQKTDKRAQKNKSCVGREGQRPTSEDIRAQALANARTARENIGEEAIQKFAQMMAAKEGSAMERAKRDIQNADVDKVLDELKFMLDDR